MKKRRKVLLALLLAFSMTATMGAGSISARAEEAATTITEDSSQAVENEAAGDEADTDEAAEEASQTSNKITVTVTTKTYQVTANCLWVRTEPSTRSDSTRAYYLTKGCTFTSSETVEDLVTGSARMWAKFTKDGKTYYCSTNSSYVTVIATKTDEYETEAPGETQTPSENPSETQTPSENPSETETSTETGSSTYYKVTASSLNVRADAGTSADKLGYVTSGQVIEVTETKDVNGSTWGKINFNGQDGWVSLAYCEKTTKEAATSATKYQITASSLNMRKGPGTSYDVVGSIPKGTVVTVTETSLVGSVTWGKTTYNGVTGWISLAYATTNITSTTTTTTVAAAAGSWKNVSGTWTYYDASGNKKFASNTMYAAWSKIKSSSSSTKYYICVNCSSCQTFIFTGSAGKWIPYKLYSCSPGASSTPTVKGTFTVGGRGYSFGKQNQYTCYYYTQFYGNYLFHSVLYYWNTKTIKDGRLGMNLSHGCVRLAIDNAQWIYNNIPNGTKVYTY